VFSFLWIGVVHVLVVKREEPGMRRKFGQSYEDYCRAVPRWLPRFGGRYESGRRES
jgi:protein-S-isoprenylcysteine O-methyltransferase Ste14